MYKRQTLAFGVLGYVLRKLDIPLAPIILALVLGQMLETNFRRALVISNGDYSVFYSSPLTLVLLAVAVLSFALPALKFLFGRFTRQRLA